MSPVIRLSDVKRHLYALAAAQPEELARAAHARWGEWPEDHGELLDFVAIEWVDREGWTVAERAAAAGDVPEEVGRWPALVRTALWVVDGWEGELALLRDIATEDEIAVSAPGLEAELPKRSVLRARVIPYGGVHVFSGEPDVYEPMGVIARMDLLRAWQESPEPGLLTTLAARRAAFRRLREERAAFLAHFGADEVVFADAADLGARLSAFVSYLLNEHRFPSLGGRTRAEATRADKGEEPAIVSFELGPTLTGPGRHGAIYDAVEGVHFLPRYGELLAHLRGEEEHPDVLAVYLDDPGITALPFRRAGVTAALARALGRDDAPMDELLAGIKALDAEVAPSVLPGWED